MNNLEEQLAKILEKALSVAEQTGEFAIEQAPLLLQEFYTWHISKNILLMFLGILIFVSLRRISFKMLPTEADNELTYGNSRFGNDKFYDTEESLGSWALIIIAYLVGLGIVARSIYKLIFMITAPKLYLIEYFLS